MRKISLLSSVLLLLLFTINVSAQQLPYPQQQEVNRLFKKSKVVYFTFGVRSMQEIPQFAKTLSVDKNEGSKVFAHADKAQFTNFMKMNLPYKIIPPPGGAKKKPVAKPVAKKPAAKPAASGTKKPAPAPAAKKAPVKK